MATTTATLIPTDADTFESPCGTAEFPDTPAGMDDFILNHLRECWECQRAAADTADIR